jgi:PAS domain S-box-containing protein
MIAHDRASILMVDEVPGKLHSYQTMLRELGEQLITATSPREALSHLLTDDVAVVLMGVSVAELRCVELANMLRKHPRLRRSAFIFVYAVGSTKINPFRGYTKVAVDYISEPVIPELLRSKVKVFTELHHKTQQLAELNRELERRVEERTCELEAKAHALEQLNRRLANRNRELDAIIQTVPGMIFSQQADGSRGYISDQFYDYTGAPPGSAAGRGWLEYVHPEDRGSALTHWAGCVESGTNCEAEYRLRSKNGGYRWFRVRAIPLMVDSENIGLRYGICSDIHDSKLLAQAVRGSATGLTTMQDQERRRIARELHDGLGQELALARIVLDTAFRKKSAQPEQAACVEMSPIIDRAIQQVRTLSKLLHPPLLDEVGLLSAVAGYVDALAERSGIEISLDVQPNKFPRLSPDLETAIFRIMQEALNNVSQHSEARRAWINLAYTDDKVSVTVRDDGKGIRETVAEPQSDSVGVGIGGIKERVIDFGGELRVRNVNPGTMVEVVIPLSPSLLQEPVLLDGSA